MSSKFICCVYDPVPADRGGLVFDPKKNRTKASFKDEADINLIMRRYNRTGILIDPTLVRTRQPMYGDFSTSAGFRELQNQLASIRQTFEALPSDLRARLGNDPANLPDYLANPENQDEAISLGLLPKATSPATSEPTVSGAEPPVVPPNASEPTAKAVESTVST